LKKTSKSVELLILWIKIKNFKSNIDIIDLDIDKIKNIAIILIEIRNRL